MDAESVHLSATQFQAKVVANYKHCEETLSSKIRSALPKDARSLSPTAIFGLTDAHDLRSLHEAYYRRLDTRTDGFGFDLAMSLVLTNVLEASFPATREGRENCRVFVRDVLTHIKSLIGSEEATAESVQKYVETRPWKAEDLKDPRSQAAASLLTASVRFSPFDLSDSRDAAATRLAANASQALASSSNAAAASASARLASARTPLETLTPPGTPPGTASDGSVSRVATPRSPLEAFTSADATLSAASERAASRTPSSVGTPSTPLETSAEDSISQEAAIAAFENQLSSIVGSTQKLFSLAQDSSFTTSQRLEMVHSLRQTVTMLEKLNAQADSLSRSARGDLEQLTTWQEPLEKSVQYYQVQLETTDETDDLSDLAPEDKSLIPEQLMEAERLFNLAKEEPDTARSEVLFQQAKSSLSETFERLQQELASRKDNLEASLRRTLQEKQKTIPDNSSTGDGASDNKEVTQTSPSRDALLAAIEQRPQLRKVVDQTQKAASKSDEEVQADQLADKLQSMTARNRPVAKPEEDDSF